MAILPRCEMSKKPMTPRGLSLSAWAWANRIDTGGAHGLDDVGGPLRVDRHRLARIGHAKEGQDRFVAVDRPRDVVDVADVAAKHGEAVVPKRKGLGVASDGADLVPCGQSLQGQQLADRTIGAEDDELHGVSLGSLFGFGPPTMCCRHRMKPS